MSRPDDIDRQSLTAARRCADMNDATIVRSEPAVSCTPEMLRLLKKHKARGWYGPPKLAIFSDEVFAPFWERNLSHPVPHWRAAEISPKKCQVAQGANGGGALPHREPSKAPFTIGISRAAPLAGQYARVIPLGPTVKVPLPVTLSGSSPVQEWLLGGSSWWGCST